MRWVQTRREFVWWLVEVGRRGRFVLLLLFIFILLSLVILSLILESLEELIFGASFFKRTRPENKGTRHGANLGQLERLKFMVQKEREGAPADQSSLEIHSI